jgi:hypothetical protein
MLFFVLHPALLKAKLSTLGRKTKKTRPIGRVLLHSLWIRRDSNALYPSGIKDFSGFEKYKNALF